ncbi:hypothetical protein ACM26V_21365 [Salipaludibacillus sp. HK11]|uniref:hypothetical protein n=1 Tax=Salipaludibacillus sp. HK11 TaxID=3394320 RepID=UPI0039FC473D
MDLNKAYEIMDVDEDVTLEKLDEQYMLWIKIKKAERDNEQENTRSIDYIDLDRITEAYQLIKNHILPKNTSHKESKNDVKAKIRHFFYYYKYHTIGVIILFYFFGVLMYNFIDHRIEQSRLANLPTPDIEILMLGDFHTENISPLEDSINRKFPEWENVQINVEYFPSETLSETGHVSMESLQVTLYDQEPDIYIMDQQHHDLLVDYDLFSPVTIQNNLKDKVEGDYMNFYEKDGENHLYGIDIARSEVLSEMDSTGNEKIASIRNHSPNHENALAFIEKSILELE